MPSSSEGAQPMDMRLAGCSSEPFTHSDMTSAGLLERVSQGAARVSGSDAELCDAGEALRLEALRELEVLDSSPEPDFDTLTELAAGKFDAPISMVSLVDADRQWLKSKVGLDVSETPRSVAFCHHAIKTSDVMVVPDALEDDRFCRNPLVQGPPGIRFYAGAPLQMSDGHRIGTLCVIDTKPRSNFGDAEGRELTRLAERASQLLALRRRNLEAARKARTTDRVQGLLELAERSAGVGTWIYDAERDEMGLSAEAASIFGFQRSETVLSGKRIATLCHPGDLARARALIERARMIGEAQVDNIRVSCPDGSARIVCARAYSRALQSSEAALIYGSVLDVTEFRRNESRLHESELLYKNITDHISDIVIKYDRAGKIEYVSPSLGNYINKPERLIGKTIHKVFPRADGRRPALEALEREAPIPKGAMNEWAFARPDGDVMWLQSNPLPVYDQDGIAKGIVTVVRDVTERKKLEAELLRKSKQAEAAASAKAEFLANMSHEIRTPLTSVLGYAGLLRKQRDLSEKAKTYAERIDRSGEALLAIVNNILDFSKLEAGRIELKLRNVCLRDLLSTVVEIVRPTSDEKGLALELLVDDQVPEAVLADGDRLRQVLLNLLGNAVKFTEKGGISISARLAGAGDKLRVEVQDTGPGIPEEVSHRLFQRFSQLDMSTTREHGGSGLGLAISKGLIQMMDGTIGFRSKPGHGATFFFEMPFLGAQEAISAGPTTEGLGVPPATRVLLVDDLAVNRELVIALLEPFDLEIVEAANGLEAVEACDRESFSVVLMDLQMPKMDGLEATRIIRTRMNRNATTPILALSANVMEGHLEACRAVGMNDHIAKPINPVELLTKLGAWADEGRSPPHANR